MLFHHLFDRSNGAEVEPVSMLPSSSEFSSLMLSGHEKAGEALGVGLGDGVSAVSGLASLAEAGLWSLVRPSATTRAIRAAWG